VHRDAHGEEPIYNLLPIAPATFYDHLPKRADQERMSDRAKREGRFDPRSNVFSTQTGESMACARYGGRNVGKASMSPPHGREIDKGHGYLREYPGQATKDR
jgi:hypothetical protein